MEIDLAKLNPAQRDAVLHVDGPLLVLAGPGSGKTRVITWRIAHMIEQGIAPWSILAVTFTNKAAAEMRERVAQVTQREGARVCTFHSFGAMFLRKEGEKLGLNRDFTIYNDTDQLSLIKKVCGELGIDKDTVTPREIRASISDAKNQNMMPFDYLSNARGYREEKIGAAYEKYSELLKENAACDFDDLLLLPVKALKDNAELREEYSKRYGYILVDEYQDTNAVQYELTKLLGGTHRNVCVTGDPDQSIYSWRGADITNILNFEKDFQDTRVVVLGQNYRSTKTIVAAADALVQYNVHRKHKELFTDNDEGASIRVMLTQNETHEGMRIAECIRDLIENEGLDYNDIAIFYRTNAQSRALEQGLREAAIPYVLVGSVEFYKRKEIVNVLAWLRLLVNPNDEVAFARAITSPSRGVGKTSIAKVISAARVRGLNLTEALQDEAVLKVTRGKPRKGLEGFAKMIAELAALPRTPVADLVSQVITQSDMEAAVMREDPLKGSERVENINELISDAALFDEANAGAELGDYLERVSLINDIDKWEPGKRVVSLMTLHSAKGLEFPAVFMTGVEDGSIPHVRSITGDSGDIEEERRLMYVGITRAKQFLFLTLARHREQFGQSMRNSPSRFLWELPKELLAFEDLSGGLFGVGMGGKSLPTNDDVPFDVGGSDDDGDLPPDDGDDVSQVGDDMWEGADTGPGMRLLAKAEPMSDARPAAAPGGMLGGKLEVGDKVRHQMFGIGKVLSFTDHGGGTRAKILFSGWGEKNLALEYAKLERVAP